MYINIEQLDQLLSNDFVIDCIQIRLTQQKTDAPIIYCGSGSIFQKPDGRFHLKLYHSFKDISKENIPNIGNTKPGKLIEEHEYFGMTATDMSGNIWIAKDISLSSSFSIPASGKVIRSSIRRLYCEKERFNKTSNESSTMFLVLPGKYTIPCNEIETFQNGGSVRNTCSLNVLGIKLKIKDRKNHLTISAKDLDGKMDLSFKERLLEALSIIFGKLCPILYMSFAAKNILTSTLTSIPNSVSNQRITSPIKHDFPSDVGVVNEFIEKYLLSFELEHGVFFGYWHKINRSWQSGIENAALTISTSIEGVTKNYYSEYGLPDDEILQQAEIAKNIIKGLDISPRIKSRVQSSIGQVKNSSPKNALYNMAAEGKVSKRLVDSWVSLRNKSAHSDNLDESAQELQKYIDDVFRCQNLFNILLLLKIQFDGQYIDLSKEDWEESTLVLGADMEKAGT